MAFICLQATAPDGTSFALIEDAEGQYVYTWRYDDADEWAVFSECMAGSINANAVKLCAEANIAAAPSVSQQLIESKLKLADRLVDLYRRNQAGVAEAIDEHLDRTGNTLGLLRDAAMPLPTPPDPKEQTR